MSADARTGELFIEIRCEELPARFIDAAAAGLAEGVRGLLKGLAHGEVKAWSTPRRLAVAVKDLAAARPVQEQLVTGPPAASAFKDGAPTPAAVGFARGKGVPVESLETVDSPRGPLIAVRVKTGGESVTDVVAAGLERVVLGLEFPKSMRWGAGTWRWARPIQGVIALYDGVRVPLSVAGVESGSSTVGHRLAPGAFEVMDSFAWERALREAHVEPDPVARRRSIKEQLEAHAAGLGAEVRNWDLLDEVVNLVEWPVVIQASVGEEFLELPPRLLVESMKVHQRVFPLYSGGRLDHHFLVVTNQPFAADPTAAATIAEGNRRVLTARFYDARFFYAEDRKKTLEEHGAKLAGMEWIRKGGTMADKASYVADLAKTLAVRFPGFGADQEQVGVAAALCKADLATAMVGEFPELQGHVGRLLAEKDGLGGNIPLAIEEHYLPRFQGDALPSTPEGRVLAIADRLDTLSRCFRLGLQPKGSADPLGLRRAAIGLLQVIFGSAGRVSLKQLLEEAALQEFVGARLRGLFQEQYTTELVNAVLATGDDDPVALQARLNAMAALSVTPEFGPLKTTFKRVMGLIKEHGDAEYDLARLDEPAERALHDALLGVRDVARKHGDNLNYGAALAELSRLKAPVDTLFDDVMVMCEDPALRHNRLSLLQAVANEFKRIADFTHLSIG